ncbi:hypothetical protein VE03_03038 [Pseudogymnoascus sp. 23342-1-I1]|nr:hypothetical protein VE03_03038 [Pseudogymnoascus sp. 23342-1-I1]
MNRLPQETIDRVAFFLPGGPDAERVHYPEIQPTRAQYATISNKFHAAIERSTFNSLRIKSDELETFARYLIPSRQGFLRYLGYTILLPAIDSALSKRFERPSETEAVSKLFSHHAKDLFDTLHRLDGLSGIDLAFQDVSHPYRRDTSSGILTDSEILELVAYDNNIGLGDSRHMRSRISLLDSEALPQLKCISRLSTGGWNRTPAPSINVDLAARMPGLTSLSLSVASAEVRYPGLLREDRDSLATMLKLRLNETKTVSDARLDMSMDGGAINQMLPMPNLTYPMGYDPLGSSLRIWSQRLTTFWFGGAIDETFFWPHALETETTPLKWPHLEHFSMWPERHTPSGWWYFMPKGNPNYGTPPRNPAEDPDDLPQPFTDNPTDGIDPFNEEEEENWDYQRINLPRSQLLTRTVPNEDTMQPLVEGFAKALQCMPSLRHARLSFGIVTPVGGDEEDQSMEDWEIIYEAPGFRNSNRKTLGDGELSSRRLIFHGTGGWRPNNDTMDLLQRIGEDSYSGTKLVVLDINDFDEIIR